MKIIYNDTTNIEFPLDNFEIVLGETTLNFYIAGVSTSLSISIGFESIAIASKALDFIKINHNYRVLIMYSDGRFFKYSKK